VGFEVELQNVTKRFDQGDSEALALADVTLTVQAGAAVAVTGPSGSGKSTLLHMVGAMDRPDEGSIRVGGVDLGSLKSRSQAAYRRRIGFVFQRFHLIPALSTIDNVLAPVVPFRTDFDRVERAKALLGSVGLGGREDSSTARLSGGEQQRIAIARALIFDPELLLADEPTGNLDSSTTEEIMQLLVDIRDAREMTLIVASHDPAVAARCERMVTLRDGRVTDDIDLDGARSDEAAMNRVIGLDLE
jgi:putative ABC transport system ATP-binding protein